MKVLSVIVWMLVPVILMVLFASVLTSRPYIRLSEGRYASHAMIPEQFDFDHRYVARQLIDYLNYRHDDLTFGAREGEEGPVMIDIEIIHMVDVKEVYTLVRVIAAISLAVVLAISIFLYKTNLRLFYYTYKNLFWLPLAFFAAVGTWVLIDFNRIFTVFHEIFFDDNWQLPMHVLIPLLPEAFWMVSAIIIVILSVGTMALIVYLNYRFVRPKVEKLS
ncbi:MAG: TIGR01906 family membrane protein [Acholeplasmatales bacterium]|nr:MAG: TIGR01906 family membrane protein [Acholeplasmatales bacterium]